MTLDMVIGTLCMFGSEIFVLINPRPCTFLYLVSLLNMWV